MSLSGGREWRVVQTLNGNNNDRGQRGFLFVCLFVCFKARLVVGRDTGEKPLKQILLPTAERTGLRAQFPQLFPQEVMQTLHKAPK